MNNDESMNEKREQEASAWMWRFDRGLTAEEQDAFFVMGHDSRLGQVVRNLLDNARSFSPPSGEVTLTLRRVPGQVELSYTLLFKVSEFALLAVSQCLKELREGLGLASP